MHIYLLIHSISAITYNDLATIIPFENSIDVWDLRGDHVKEIFEHAVDGEWKPASFDLRFFTQVSGKLTMNTFDLLKCRCI